MLVLFFYLSKNEEFILIYKLNLILLYLNQKSEKSEIKMKSVLMVAEKPSLANSLAVILSNGNMTTRKGLCF